jgi:hypothetical protein
MPPDGAQEMAGRSAPHHQRLVFGRTQHQFAIGREATAPHRLGVAYERVQTSSVPRAPKLQPGVVPEKTAREDGPAIFRIQNLEMKSQNLFTHTHTHTHATHTHTHMLTGGKGTAPDPAWLALKLGHHLARLHIPEFHLAVPASAQQQIPTQVGVGRKTQRGNTVYVSPHDVKTFTDPGRIFRVAHAPNSDRLVQGSGACHDHPPGVAGLEGTAGDFIRMPFEGVQ